MQSKLTKEQEVYLGYFYNNEDEDDIETFEITKTTERAYGPKGALMIKTYDSRYRTPEQSISFFEEIIKCLKENFI